MLLPASSSKRHSYTYIYKSFNSFIIQHVEIPLCILAIHKRIYIQYNTLTNQHNKYIHESVRDILTRNKVFFLISKDFIIYIDTFLISVTFSVVISSINLGIFDLFQDIS